MMQIPKPSTGTETGTSAATGLTPNMASDSRASQKRPAFPDVCDSAKVRRADGLESGGQISGLSTKTANHPTQNSYSNQDTGDAKT